MKIKFLILILLLIPLYGCTVNDKKIEYVKDVVYAENNDYLIYIGVIYSKKEQTITTYDRYDGQICKIELNDDDFDVTYMYRLWNYIDGGYSNEQHLKIVTYQYDGLYVETKSGGTTELSYNEYVNSDYSNLPDFSDYGRNIFNLFNEPQNDMEELIWEYAKKCSNNKYSIEGVVRKINGQIYFNVNLYDKTFIESGLKTKNISKSGLYVINSDNEIEIIKTFKDTIITGFNDRNIICFADDKIYSYDIETKEETKMFSSKDYCYSFFGDYLNIRGKKEDYLYNMDGSLITKFINKSSVLYLDHSS